MILKKLDELLEGFKDFRKLGPAEWGLCREELITDAKTKRTLFVFDDDLGEREKKGTEWILDIAPTLTNTIPLFCLLSFNVKADTELEQTRTFWDKKVCASAIPKRELTNATGLGALYQRLRATVLWHESQELRESCKNAMEASLDKALERMGKLLPLEFDEAIFGSSYDEGAHEVDTLLRVYSNTFLSHFRETLRQKPEVLDDISKLRNYRAPSEDVLMGSEVWKLQHEELYDSAQFLNECHIPTGAGDIFELTALSGESLGEYVLISGPCDLMVRSTEQRKVETSLLCPVTKTATRSAKADFDLPSYQLHSGEAAAVDMSIAMSFHLWVLDLCVLNSDGTAAINFDGLPPPYLSEGWQRHYTEILCPRARGIASAMTDPEQLEGEQFDAALACIAAQFRLPKDKCLRVESVNPSIVRFGVKRTRRLASDLTAELLQAYGDHLSRPARPHPLSRSS